MTDRAGNRPRSGLALLRKPEGVTSFQALSPVKRAMGSGKVGHTGTLDRFASGLLVIMTGSYSRLASYVMAGEKHYIALLAFGSETSTLDPEGEVVGRAPPPSRAAIEEALGSFRGPILQVPPVYSAIHVAGKRAYQIAREGGEVELKERPVEIFSLELLGYEEGDGGDPSFARIDVRCSSGTYIRSLARDIALACGSRAHLGALERLSIGPFNVEDAVSPGDFDPELHLRLIGPKEASRLGLRCLALRGTEDVARFLNGGRMSSSSFEVLEGGSAEAGRGGSGPSSAVFATGGELLGIIDLEDEGPSYKVVMPQSIIEKAGEPRS